MNHECHECPYCGSKNIRKVKEEGMVIKAYEIPEQFQHWREFAGGMITAKVKLDVPEPIRRKISKGEPILPLIPENEIFGAISKVEADYGLTAEPKHDMPLIAKYVNEECKKHLYSSRGNLFHFYQKYLELHPKKKK
jgi:hypothetical protein